MWLSELNEETFFFMPNKTAHVNATFLSLWCQYLRLTLSLTEGGDCETVTVKGWTGLKARFTLFLPSRTKRTKKVMRSSKH